MERVENGLSGVPVAMTIAGSDSGGGAGIQADLRTFSFHCVHGTCALTCVTAQNTSGVMRVDALSPEAVTAQIDAVAADIGVGAIKTGMLLNAGIIEAVARRLRDLPVSGLVVDPVMVSRTGAQLIDDRAISTLKRELLPRATIATPNRYEAQILAGMAVDSVEQMREAARRIHAIGPEAVLVKGGGMEGELRGVDLWFDGETFQVLKTATVDTPHTHGTGCTLSAAIAANLALGYPPAIAVRRGKQYVTDALAFSLHLGRGQGPVGHFFPLLREAFPD